MAVTYSVRSMVTAGFIGGGAAVQFRTRADPDLALEALVAAADVAEQQFRDDLEIRDDVDTVSTSAAALNPAGPILVMQLCDSAELLERWCQVVASELETAGLSGKLAPATSIDIPTVSAPAVTACLQLEVDWNALLNAPAAYTSPSAGWWVDEARTARLLDVTLPWLLEAPGEVYVRAGVSTPLSRNQVRPIIADFLNHGDYGAEAYVIDQSDATSPRVRSVKFLEKGTVYLNSYDIQSPWTEHVETVQAPVQALAYDIVHAFIRPVVLTETDSSGAWYRVKPEAPLAEEGRIGSALWAVLHLLADHVPDAYGFQVLTHRHLNRLGALDATRWVQRELGEGRFLVTAVDLSAWLDSDYTPYRLADGDNPYTRSPSVDAGLLEQARRDFESLIISVQTVRDSPPPEIKHPNVATKV